MTEYIEREAVKEKLSPMLNDPEAVDFWEWQCSEIDDIPAADVREVVRGKWEDVNVRDFSTNINGGLPLNVASMSCSVCKRWHNEVYHYGNPAEMARFCPNCGADMREPPKEET